MTSRNAYVSSQRRWGAQIWSEPWKWTRSTLDQVHYQHERLDLHHPRGGQAEYLRQPLLDKTDQYMQHLADHVLDGGLDQAMADNMENLSDEVTVKAPVEFSNLRESGHPTVTSDGVTVYDRAPAQARLTEDELRALSKARGGHPYGNRGRHR